MAFLHFLADYRSGLLDAIFSNLTYLGDETAFMALALLFFWCINKRTGYFIFFTGFIGTILNQFLKLWFRIPRPWVLDPNFQIVEAAREGASGYSFPSGHTQNIVGTLGVIALTQKQKWVRILCGILIILVPFSRMYLGVHTPLDVSVSFVVAVILLALLVRWFKEDTTWHKAMPILFIVLGVLIVLYLVFILCYPFPADIDPDNLYEGSKNSYVMLGCGLGLLVAYFYDRRFLNFSTKAPILGQILKFVLGVGLLVAIRVVLKAPLHALFHGNLLADGIRYFVMVLFAGCIWPYTFPLFAKIGQSKRK